jgi:branched-chain amino acid transport system substrate-binding protein
MRRGSLLVACAVGLAAVSLAGARPAETPGVTSTKIVLGATAPLSGVASAFASVERGAAAYFAYVNAHGGVNGRTIDYRIADDGFNPAQTVPETRRLVEQEKVFAMVNSLGTEENLAVAQYLNDAGVPQLFVATGVASLGDAKRYPWTVGYIPSFTAEGRLYGRYLATLKGTHKIAVLAPNDEGGNNLVAGLRSGLGGKASWIADVQQYDPLATTIQSELAKLAQTRADLFLNFGTPAYALQAFLNAFKLGWTPQTIVPAYSSASSIIKIGQASTSPKQIAGTVSTVFVKDPTDPRWNKDKTVALYRSIMKKYQPSGDVNDPYNLYGMAVAYTTVDVLKKAGRNLTRAGVLKAALHLNESNPFLPPEIKVKTSPTDRFPIEQARLIRWRGDRWASFGPVYALGR